MTPQATCPGVKGTVVSGLQRTLKQIEEEVFIPQDRALFLRQEIHATCIRRVAAIKTLARWRRVVRHNGPVCRRHRQRNQGATGREYGKSGRFGRRRRRVRSRYIIDSIVPKGGIEPP